MSWNNPTWITFVKPFKGKDEEEQDEQDEVHACEHVRADDVPSAAARTRRQRVDVAALSTLTPVASRPSEPLMIAPTRKPE